MANEDHDAARSIRIKGAREHNLKNVDVTLPRDRLVVITGVSGSGKSSLAFDTIYAEGYRKYIDSLSVRARTLLDQVKRPEVDFIEGLSPVIAIQQREGTGANPRSTVATITEIADYARLLWSIVGVPHCPLDGGRIERRSIDDCLTRIFQEPADSRIVLLAPYFKAKPSMLREEIPHLRQRGFQRIRIDGEIHNLEDHNIVPGGTRELPVDIVIDRLVLRKDQRSRLADSLELAFREGKDKAIVMLQEDRESPWRELRVSQQYSCTVCGEVYDPVTPRHFSYNHPDGACEECGGLGETMQFADDLLVPDPTKSVRGGAIKPWRLGSKRMIIQRNAILKQLAEQLPFDGNAPWEELSAETRHTILHGAGDRLFSFKTKPGNRKPEVIPFAGVIADLEQTRRDTSSDGLRARLMAYQVSSPCSSCEGRRLRSVSRHVRLAGRGFADFMEMTVDEAHDWIGARPRDEDAVAKVTEAVTGLEQRLGFLRQVGVGYLSLSRPYTTLSGGESQRVRLATQLGMGLVGVAYVLDEPTIGLHPHDNRKLLDLLVAMRNRGNAVIIVEHDEDSIRLADHMVELGPGAGDAGGRVIFEGTPEEAMESRTSRTGPYLSGKAEIYNDAGPRYPLRGWLQVLGAREHNLKEIDALFPYGLVTCVTGVSGSGKSTLINEILGKAAAFKLNGAKEIPGRHERIEGLDAFKRVVRVDQEPIGRSPRSNPATYTKLFDALRNLYAKVPLARVRGYTPSRFSFNVRGGRCERCKGDGAIKLDMQFLHDVFVECPSCHGQRYNRESLEVRFKGMNIAEVLDCSVDEAVPYFRAQPRIASVLETLTDVGLGYLKLGQSATTLSGGEAQRIKLALELSKRQQGETLYLLDEPTTGLHWADIQRLMDLLFRLRDAGNTIVIIEHNLDVLRIADWVIDLGPGAGDAGGELVFAGSVPDLLKSKDSLTAQCLRDYFAQRPQAERPVAAVPG